MEEHLKTTYGFNSFRKYQKEIITDILNNENVLAILPTGGGKSLLYQFPATYKKKITIVVSPLISLMNDQRENLTSKNIKAICLNSEVSVDINNIIKQEIIYTTPEYIISNIEYFEDIKENICLFAIDEAHCVSQWSHDFRPSYQNLGIIKEKFENIPLLTVTATATPRVIEEIYEFTNVYEVNEYILGTRRDNLYIKVKKKSEFDNLIIDEQTIIYTQTRKECERLYNEFVLKGIKCCYYHAGMSKEDKMESHQKFINGEILLIIATISFGMGIDKSDIRHVINYGVPSDIETYYQEIGRAGRDGINSKATIYYNERDFHVMSFIISKTSDENLIKIKNESLSILRKYLQENNLCRQQMIEYYFKTGTFSTELDLTEINKCNICDNCIGDNDVTIRDISVESKIIYDFIKRQSFNIGTQKLYKLITKYKPLNISENYFKDIIEILITKNILSRSMFGYGYVIGLGKINVNNALPIKVRINYDHNEFKQFEYKQYNSEYIYNIREKLSNKYNIKPTLLINDRVLLNIRETKPNTLTDLWKINGISQDFITNYGGELLNELKLCQEKLNDIKPKSKKKKESKTNTQMETYNLYKQGKSIKEIVEIRSFKRMTIEKHILSIWENDKNEKIDKDYVGLTQEYENEIKNAINNVGTNKLRDIKDIVSKNITYLQIQTCILLMK